MVKKCCVTGCNSGYLTSHEKVPVFRLPSDPDEYLRWLEVCYGLVELTSYLLSTSHEYVCLGVFSTDKLENGFSKLRQGSGGVSYCWIRNS